MKIKKLMDYLNRESDESHDQQIEGFENEKVVYIENSRFETDQEQAERRELLAAGTQWTDQLMGDLLVDQGKLDRDDVARIIEHQREQGIYFGEAAVDLKVVSQKDILNALCIQFGYTYNRGEESISKELSMAHSPFGEQAEEFRSIRSQLLNNWLSPDNKVLAIVSPGNAEGRSYVAANLAMAFAQLGRPTLLIDADLRSPRQHEMFNLSRKSGLSMLLAGRIRMEDLDVLPDQLPGFQYLSILGSGAVPPNPTELLSRNTLSLIIRELKKYFDVIIIDTPAAIYQSDVASTVSAAGSALLVTKSGGSKVSDVKNLITILNNAKAKVVGAVLNRF